MPEYVVPAESRTDTGKNANRAPQPQHDPAC